MAGQIPMVMTLKEFKKASTPKNFLKRGRGALLTNIDKTLDAYHKLGGTADKVSKDEKLCLMVLVQHCRNWLIAKAHKDTTTFKLRQEAVNEVVSAATGRLAYGPMSSAKETGKKSDTKTLSAGYAQERAHYEATNKAVNPASGSTMSYLLEQFTGPFASMPEEIARQNQELQSILVKPFASLTDAEFVKLYEKLTDTEKWSAAIGQPATVLFLKKNQRLRFLSWPDEGMLYNDTGPLDTKGQSWMYAMDCYGSLFTTFKKDANEKTKFVEFEQDQANMFNHSSFLAGKDVICAGMLEATKGQLMFIDNSSGHYKPSREHLMNCLNVLKDTGLQMKKAKVDIWESGEGGEPVVHSYKSADALIEHPDMDPDGD